MQLDQHLLTAARIYEEGKFWFPVLGAMFAFFKAFSWVKNKEKDLAEINPNIQSMKSEIKSEIAHQTNILTDQFKEMRNDFRAFYAFRTQEAPMMARPYRPRKKKTEVLSVETTE